MRFWISWWGGKDDDCRPLRDDESTPAWACSGQRVPEPCFSICAVIDAESEEKAWEIVLEYWPEAVERFCNEKPGDWLPGDRFRCIEEKLRERCAG